MQWRTRASYLAIVAPPTFIPCISMQLMHFNALWPIVASPGRRLSPPPKLAASHELDLNRHFLLKVRQCLVDPLAWANPASIVLQDDINIAGCVQNPADKFRDVLPRVLPNGVNIDLSARCGDPRSYANWLFGGHHAMLCGWRRMEPQKLRGKRN